MLRKAFIKVRQKTSTRIFACNCINVNISRSYEPLCVCHWISSIAVLIEKKKKIWNYWKSMKCMTQHDDKAL